MNDITQISNLKAARHHQSRARVEAEAFEAALLAQVQTPVQIALAKTAASFYLAVRTYHWRRMSRAKQRPRDLSEAVAAGNALDRVLDSLGMIPNAKAGPANADVRPTAPPAANVSHAHSDAGKTTAWAWERPADCTCPPNAKVYCAACTESLQAYEAARRAARP